MQRFLLIFFTMVIEGQALSIKTKLVVGASSSAIPYMFQSQGRGIVVDIVTKAFEEAGLKSQFLFSSNLRIKKEFTEKRIPCAFAAYKFPAPEGIYLSDSIISYNNVFIALKESNKNLTKLDDIGNYKIAAFQNSTLLLGHEYKKAVRNNLGFIEVTNQKTQIPLLLSKRVDFIVLDEIIFKYYLANLSKYFPGYSPQDFSRFKLFKLLPPSPHRLSFWDKDLRDRFNQGLKKVNPDHILNEYRKNAYMPPATL